MKSTAVCVTIFLFCAAFAFSDTQEKYLSLSADGIEVLKIDCGAGTLDIKGDASLDEIEVTAEIVIKGASEKRAKEIIQKQVQLSLEKRGSKAVLLSHFNSSFSIISVGGKSINLTVRIPEHMDIDIEDGSGEIGVENIAGEVRIDDGSGAIRVQGIDGDLDVDDGSGSIFARNIEGNVTLRDGSGSIEVDGVSGDVILKDDGSGGVRITNVKGRVEK